MKKKLLFYISQFYKGGAEVSLLNLMKSLDYDKYDVDFIVSNNSNNNYVSLEKELPYNINFLDAFLEDKKFFLKKIRFKLFYKKRDQLNFKFSELEFVKNKLYYAAFHIGEWTNPEFIAKKVNSDRKYLWIHNDLNIAEYFDEENFFNYYDYFDKTIFVSDTSMKESIKKYPFLEKKSVVVHNILDSDEIIKKSNLMMDLDIKTYNDCIKILTVANFRPQKNHIRQVKVLKILKDKGFNIKWINIGIISDKTYYNLVVDEVKKNGLEKEFIILGPKDNPYNYIKFADIIAVLSDYESWSMVITEALILKKIIVSTKTSGAIEQIENGINGFLVNFEISDIVKCIENIINNKINLIPKPLISKKEILKEFENLFLKKKLDKKNILYFIDDINYIGGAHIATSNQINYFNEKFNITIFSDYIPSINNRLNFKNVDFINWDYTIMNKIYEQKILYVLFSKNYTFKQKVNKLKMSFNNKILKNENGFYKYVYYSILNFIENNYDCFVVMSEGSSFRKMVSKIKNKNKIQWIHTDYLKWKDLNEWTIEVTKNDRELYESFDFIVLLSKKLKNDFDKIYPNFSEKTIVINNIYDIKNIKNCYNQKINKKKYPKLRLLSIIRFDNYKDPIRTIKIIEKLVYHGYDVELDILGTGELFGESLYYIKNNSLEKNIFLRGFQKNPYKFFKDKDMFILLSHYEGTPNTIYESLILGTPVLSTDVGGVMDQIIDKKTGWIVKDSDIAIYEKIKYLIENQSEINKVKEYLFNYEYNNLNSIEKLEELFNK